MSDRKPMTQSQARGVRYARELDGPDLAPYGAESGDKICWGAVSIAHPPEYLEYSFTIKPIGGTESTVRWTLNALEGGTHLSLEHVGLPQSVHASGLTLALDKSWDNHIGRMRADIHQNTN